MLFHWYCHREWQFSPLHAAPHSIMQGGEPHLPPPRPDAVGATGHVLHPSSFWRVKQKGCACVCHAGTNGGHPTASLYRPFLKHGEHGATERWSQSPNFLNAGRISWEETVGVNTPSLSLARFLFKSKPDLKIPAPSATAKEQKTPSRGLVRSAFSSAPTKNESASETSASPPPS